MRTSARTKGPRLLLKGKPPYNEVATFLNKGVVPRGVGKLPHNEGWLPRHEGKPLRDKGELPRGQGKRAPDE